MEKVDRDKLQKHYKNLSEVMYSCVSGHILSAFIIDLKMHLEIQSQTTDPLKMDKLLTILPTRGPHAMKEFINALKPAYPWLAEKLEKDDSNPAGRASATGNEVESDDNLLNNPAEVVKLKPICVKDYMSKVEKILQSSKVVCNEWWKLSRSLGVKTSIEADIKRDVNAGTMNMDMIIHTLITHWTEEKGQNANFKGLIECLREEEMNYTAERIEELWKQLQ